MKRSERRERREDRKNIAGNQTGQPEGGAGGSRRAGGGGGGEGEGGAALLRGCRSNNSTTQLIQLGAQVFVCVPLAVSPFPATSIGACAFCAGTPSLFGGCYREPPPQKKRDHYLMGGLKKDTPSRGKGFTTSSGSGTQARGKKDSRLSWVRQSRSRFPPPLGNPGPIRD